MFLLCASLFWIQRSKFESCFSRKKRIAAFSPLILTSFTPGRKIVYYPPDWIFSSPKFFALNEEHKER